MNQDELPTRLTIQYVLVRADRRYAQEHLTKTLPPDRMDTLIRAVDANFGAAAVREVELVAANAKALLGRLVTAVVGEWDVDGNVVLQVKEALRQLRQVEAYLLSQNAALRVTPTERGVA